MSLKIENRPFDPSETLAARFPPGSKGVTDAGASFGSVLRSTQAQQSEASQELDKYLKMTPEERTAIAMRKQLGISEEQYAAMSPDEKKAVDLKVAQMVKEKLDEQMARQQAAPSLMSGISL
jgi:Trp operon repressor